MLNSMEITGFDEIICEDSMKLTLMICLGFFGVRVGQKVPPAMYLQKYSRYNNETYMVC